MTLAPELRQFSSWGCVARDEPMDRFLLASGEDTVLVDVTTGTLHREVAPGLLSSSGVWLDDSLPGTADVLRTVRSVV